MIMSLVDRSTTVAIGVARCSWRASRNTLVPPAGSRESSGWPGRVLAVADGVP
jgi:hypothetical protein